MGKVQASVGVLEKLSSLGMSVLGGLLYKATLEHFPGGLFLVVAGLYLVNAVLISVIQMLISKKNSLQL